MPEGSLTGQSSLELSSTIAIAVQIGFQVELDLSSLQFVDDEGLTLLRSLIKSSIAVHSPSPFVSELLKQ
jgi:anti-anti-sigma regulatory factor